MLEKPDANAYLTFDHQFDRLRVDSPRAKEQPPDMLRTCQGVGLGWFYYSIIRTYLRVSVRRCTTAGGYTNMKNDRDDLHPPSLASMDTVRDLGNDAASRGVTAASLLAEYGLRRES
jgi:hypothetical protein